MGNKYKPLRDFLLDISADTTQITISFRELSTILGAELPAAAMIYCAWWGNQKDTTVRPQAYAWSSAGFEVERVLQDPERGWVRFRRKRRSAPQSSRPLNYESARRPEPLQVASSDCTDRHPSV